MLVESQEEEEAKQKQRTNTRSDRKKTIFCPFVIYTKTNMNLVLLTTYINLLHLFNGEKKRVLIYTEDHQSTSYSCLLVTGKFMTVFKDNQISSKPSTNILFSIKKLKTHFGDST